MSAVTLTMYGDALTVCWHPSTSVGVTKVRQSDRELWETKAIVFSIKGGVVVRKRQKRS